MSGTSAGVKKGWAKFTPAQRKARAAKANAIRRARETPKQRRAHALKMVKARQDSPK